MNAPSRSAASPLDCIVVDLRQRERHHREERHGDGNAMRQPALGEQRPKDDPAFEHDALLEAALLYIVRLVRLGAGRIHP
jgi:hypothetical protein